VHIDTWLLYAGATCLLSLTPGPNGLLALTHGGLFGARRTMATALGGVSGFSVLIALSISGLGALLVASEQLFNAIRWLGALYLMWLGYRTWRTPVVVQSTTSSHDNTRSFQSLFSEGLVVALSNPKAILFFAAFLPQFLDPASSLLLQFVIMALTLAVIEFVIEIGLAASSERLLPWLSKDRNSRWFQRTTGGVFVGAGAAMLVLHR
jgi:homoserine/homoserine lactone efflux protein